MVHERWTNKLLNLGYYILRGVQFSSFRLDFVLCKTFRLFFIARRALKAMSIRPSGGWGLREPLLPPLATSLITSYLIHYIFYTFYQQLRAHCPPDQTSCQAGNIRCEEPVTRYTLIYRINFPTAKLSWFLIII